MRKVSLLFWLLFWPLPSHLAPHFIIVGGAQKPVGVFIKPLEYHGTGVSPAVDIENILLAALAQSGLFYQPGRQQPQTNWSLAHWRLAGVRYLISGRIEENDRAINLYLTLTDTLGTTPTNVWVELNADVWQQATRVFARQLFYSLFYATFTDDINSQYLHNTQAEETRYWISLVQTLKSHWDNRQNRGQCQVKITQLPGGQIQAYDIEADCEEALFEEIQALFERLSTLPYGGLNAPFAQYFTVTFVARG